MIGELVIDGIIRRLSAGFIAFLSAAAPSFGLTSEEAVRTLTGEWCASNYNIVLVGEATEQMVRVLDGPSSYEFVMNLEPQAGNAFTMLFKDAMVRAYYDQDLGFLTIYLPDGREGLFERCK